MDAFPLYSGKFNESTESGAALSGREPSTFPVSGQLPCSLGQFGCHFLLWETLLGMLLVNIIYDTAAGERKPLL